MKKWSFKIRNLFVQSLALPSDVILGLPRLTAIGDIHLYIENHKGLEVYSETELKLKTTTGFVQIRGNGFVLKLMLPEEILLEGKIKEINYITGS